MRAIRIMITTAALIPDSARRLGALWLLACLATPPAASQLPTDTDTREASGGIEEIVVTARRRDENLQEVGIALTAISGDTLEQLRFQDARDLALQVPSLQIQATFGMSNPALFLRGVGVNDISAVASSAVSFYLDETYLGSPAGQLFQFFDLERVEVLRGPQGTLYGRNTPAGAVNFSDLTVSKSRPGWSSRRWILQIALSLTMSQASWVWSTPPGPATCCMPASAGDSRAAVSMARQRSTRRRSRPSTKRHA